MNVRTGSGVVSASVLAIILAGAVSGVIIVLVLSGLLANQLVLAVFCAFVAAILALVAGYVILGRSAELALPCGGALLNVVIASLIGGLAGHEHSVDLREPPASPLVGTISGLLAAILISSFVITVFTLSNRASGRKE